MKRTISIIAISTIALITALAFQNCSSQISTDTPNTKSETENPTLQSSSCKGSQAVGNWVFDPLNPGSPRLTLREDCTGFDERCQSAFTVELGPENSNSAVIKVTEMHGDPNTCLPVGETRCEFNVAAGARGPHLQYQCGSLAANFETPIGSNALPTESSDQKTISKLQSSVLGLQSSAGFSTFEGVELTFANSTVWEMRGRLEARCDFAGAGEYYSWREQAFEINARAGGSAKIRMLAVPDAPLPQLQTTETFSYTCEFKYIPAAGTQAVLKDNLIVQEYFRYKYVQPPRALDAKDFRLESPVLLANAAPKGFYGDTLQGIRLQFTRTNSDPVQGTIDMQCVMATPRSTRIYKNAVPTSTVTIKSLSDGEVFDLKAIATQGPLERNVEYTISCSVEIVKADGQTQLIRSPSRVVYLR